MSAFYLARFNDWSPSQLVSMALQTLRIGQHSTRKSPPPKTTVMVRKYSASVYSSLMRNFLRHFSLIANPFLYPDNTAKLLTVHAFACLDAKYDANS